VANINAKSDQLDLIPLTETLDLGLEPGGAFQGLQGLSLSGWNAPRFVSPGGRLQLVPGAPPALIPATPIPAAVAARQHRQQVANRYGALLGGPRPM
jgi:hypothetical protein